MKEKCPHCGSEMPAEIFRPKRLRTVDDTIRWLDKANKGDKAMYHVGYLAKDRDTHHFMAVGKRSDVLLKAAEDGIVHLVQERIGENSWRYLAVKR